MAFSKKLKTVMKTNYIDDDNSYDMDDIIIRNTDRISKNGKFEYFLFDLEKKVSPTKTERFFKAIRLNKMKLVPKKELGIGQFLEMETGVITGFYQSQINYIQIFANIIQPQKELIFAFGAQGISTVSIDEAKHNADKQMAAIQHSMTGTFKTLQYIDLTTDDADWIMNKLVTMKDMRVIRGIPTPKIGGNQSSSTSLSSMFSGSENSSYEMQNEEFLLGMDDYEYIMVLTATTVSAETMAKWRTANLKEQTYWASLKSGQKAMSFGISMPMVYGSNQSASRGWGTNRGQSFGTSYSHGNGTSESFATGTSHSISHSTSNSISNGISRGVSTSQSYGANNGSSWNTGRGTSNGLSQGVSTSDSLSYSHGSSHSLGNSLNVGNSFNAGTSDSHGTSSSIGTSNNFGTSENYGTSHNVGTSDNYGTSENYGTSQNVGTSDSYGSSSSVGTSHSVSNSHGTTASSSHGVSVNDGYGISHSSTGTHSWGQSGGWSSSKGSTQGLNIGISGGGDYLEVNAGYNGGSTTSKSYNGGFSSSDSRGWSDSTSASHSSGQSWSNSNSVSNTTSISDGMSTSYGTSQSHGMTQSYGTTQSNGISQSHGLSQSNGFSTSNGMSTSQGLSTSDGISTSHGISTSQGISTGQGLSYSDGTSSSKGLSSGVGTSNGLSAGNSTSDSYGQSQGASVSAGVGTSDGFSQSVSQGVSNGESLGTSATHSLGSSESYSSGISNGSSTGSSTSGGFSSGSSGSMGLGPSLSFSKTFAWEDREVTYVLDQLVYATNRIIQGTNNLGMWYVDIYIATESEIAAEAASSVAISAWHDGNALITPLQAYAPSDQEREYLMKHMSVFSPSEKKDGNSGEMNSYKYSTPLLSSELAAYCHPPRVNVGGIKAAVDDPPVLPVPSDRQNGEIFLGYVRDVEKYNKDREFVSQYRYTLSSSEIHHAYISGASRSGKTVAAMRLVSETYNNVRRGEDHKRMRFLIMDPKNDWRALSQVIPSDHFRFYSLANPLFRPIKMNLMKIPIGVYTERYADKLREMFIRSYGLGDRGFQIFGKAINDVYQKAGCYDEDVMYNQYDPKTGTYPATERSKNVTLQDVTIALMSQIEEKGTSRDKAEAIQRIVDRLDSFAEPRSSVFRIFCNRGDEGLGIDDLLGADDVVVLESYGMDTKTSAFVFGLLVTAVYQYAVSNGGFVKPKNQYETVIVIEEANQVLIGNDDGSGGSGDNLGGANPFEVVLDQSAGYGLFIWTMTQKISQMPTSVLANSALKIIGRQDSEDDINTSVVQIGKKGMIVDRIWTEWFPDQPTGWFIIKSSRNMDYTKNAPCHVQIKWMDIKTPDDEELDRIIKTGEVKRLLEQRKKEAEEKFQKSASL